MKPKVSVIVPCYKVEKYLDRCVESLVNQTLRDIEIILVDDGSPDRVPQMCDDWAAKDSRIRVVHKKNGGLGMACNSGIEVASGDYIAFVDSDDWVDNSMYEYMYSKAIAINADIVYSGIRRVDQNGVVTIMAQSDMECIYKSRNDLEKFAMDMIANEPSVHLERRVPMSAKIVLYKKSMIDINRIRFESEREFITEDLLFNLDCLNQASLVVELSKTFYNYFVNTDSLSQVIRTDRFLKAKIVYKELLRRYNFSNVEFKCRVQRFLIGYARIALCQIGNSCESLQNKIAKIHEVYDDSVWKEVAIDYPIFRMPLVHGIFLWFIMRRMAIMILIMAKLHK